MTIVRIKKTHSPIKYDESAVLSEPFIITTGYLRLSIDTTLQDKESACAYIEIGNNPTVREQNGFLINKGNSEIIKIAAPKKFVGARIFPNAHQTTISFIGNGIEQQNPFSVGDYITVTNCLDESYNQAVVHCRVVQSTKDCINLDIELTGYTESNSALVVNLSTRIAVCSVYGTGLLSVAEVHPVS